MAPLEVVFTMHLLFISFIVFANLVDQVGDSYNILYMNNLVTNIVQLDALVTLDAFISSTNKPWCWDIKYYIMGFVVLLRFTRQEFYYGLLDMTHVRVLLYYGVTTYITPSLDNLWGQWRSGICNIITRAFMSLKMVIPLA